VVAHEVGALAGRTSDAAHQTASLVESILERSGRNADDVTSATSVLEAMAEDAVDLQAVLADATTRMEAQRGEVARLRDAMSRLLSATHQVAASADESAAAASELSRHASALDDISARFSVEPSSRGRLARAAHAGGAASSTTLTAVSRPAVRDHRWAAADA